MRLFWALELPDAHRDALLEMQVGLGARDRRTPVRWVRRDELHLTLKFLGDATDDGAMQEAVRTAVRGCAPLELRLGAAGSFGGARPRVLWAAVEGPGLPALAELAGRIEDACLLAGFPRDARGFHPHVTLGRVAQGRGTLLPLRDALRRVRAPAALASFEVRQVVLFESRLERGRPPVYSVRARLDLTT